MKEFLDSKLIYDPETGSLTWRGGRFVGQNAIHLDDRGRGVVQVARHRRPLAIRVIYTMMTGTVPHSLLRFKDGNPMNTKWANIGFVPDGAAKSNHTGWRLEKRVRGLHGKLVSIEKCIRPEYEPLRADNRILRDGNRRLIVHNAPESYSLGDPLPHRSALFQKTGKAFA